MTTLNAVNGPFSSGPEVRVGVHRRVAVVAVVRRVAAPVVAVDAGAGEAVEAVDGRDEAGRVDVELGGELADAVGLDHDAVLGHQLVLAGVHRVAAQVAARVPSVGDQPVRTGLVVLEHVVAEVDVRLRLVGEPVTLRRRP